MCFLLLQQALYGPNTPSAPRDLVTPGCDRASLRSRVLHEPVPLLPSNHSGWVVVGVCNASVDVGNLLKICQTQCSAPKPSEGLSLRKTVSGFWVTAAKSNQVKHGGAVSAWSGQECSRCILLFFCVFPANTPWVLMCPFRLPGLFSAMTALCKEKRTPGFILAVPSPSWGVDAAQ